MTNHWRDIRHADVILINGANPAEAHPVVFRWSMKAKLDPTQGPGAGGRDNQLGSRRTAGHRRHHDPAPHQIRISAPSHDQ